MNERTSYKAAYNNGFFNKVYRLLRRFHLQSWSLNSREKAGLYNLRIMNAYQENITKSVFREKIVTDRYFSLGEHFSVAAKSKSTARANIIDMMYYKKRHRSECGVPVFGTFNQSDTNGRLNGEDQNLACTKADLSWTISVMKEMPNRLGDALVYLMEKRGVSIRTLADRTLLSEKDIQRMRNNNSRPKVNKLVAVCIGLNLCPRISTDLMKKAGYNLRMDEEEQAYQMILIHCFDMSIYECNDILQKMGYTPLTKI